MSSRKAEKIGDNADMVLARSNFLSASFYLPLADAISETIRVIKGYYPKILDLGCGTGYYSAAITSRLPSARLACIDISKTALKNCARLNPGALNLVANMNSLPFVSGCFDVVLSVFAPLNEQEVMRVLASDGVLIEVSPGPNHLIEIKNALYGDKTYLNEVTSRENLNSVGYREITYKMDLTQPDVVNLLRMTPYFYKTSLAARERLLVSPPKCVTASFVIHIYG